MNPKAIIPLVAGLAIGGFALKIGLDTLQKARGASGAAVPVWAAKVNITRGTFVTEEMIESIAFPAELVPAGALKEKERVVGRVPRVDAPAGLPILDDMLLAPGQRPGVHVPPGYRAVAVKVDESSGVDFHLEPGCHVDVVGFFKIGSGREQRTVARTLMENVELAAVGPRISPVTREGEGKKSRPTRAVTLLVKPGQVPLLHMAEQKGKIKLSMRGDEDAERVGIFGPVSEAELLDPNAKYAEDESAGSAGEQAGLFGWLRGALAKPRSEPQPVEPVPVVVAEPEEPPAEPEWLVYVWRGEKLEVVRYRNQQTRERLVDQPEQKRGGARRRGPAPTGRYVPPPVPQQPAALRPLPAQPEPKPEPSSAHQQQNSGLIAAFDKVLTDLEDRGTRILQPESEEDQEQQEPIE